MTKGMKWFLALAAVALIGVLVYSSLQQSRYSYEVCITFRGRSHCAMAAGRTADEAIHSAHEIDCALLAASRDENIACLDTAPTSVHAVSSP